MDSRVDIGFADDNTNDVAWPTPDMNELWAETYGHPDITIAVLDGPVDTSHTCFEGADLTPVETLVPADTSPGIALAHGTHVASIIFAQHNSPIRGIAPLCRGLILPVFRSGADGSVIPCSQMDLARAINQAVEHGAQIINISGGQLARSEEADRYLENAVRNCADNGVLIVAAAGNNGCPCLHVPAALPSVLVVGAMDSNGLPMDFSNWGEAYRDKGILAPGEAITGAMPGEGIVQRTGTSFATPIVSGIAALLLSTQLKRGEKPDVAEVRRAILESVDSCDQQIVSDCRRFLAGGLNISGALARIKNLTKFFIANREGETDMIKPEEAANIGPDTTAQSEGVLLSESGNADSLSQAESLMPMPSSGISALSQRPEAMRLARATLSAPQSESFHNSMSVTPSDVGP